MKDKLLKVSGTVNKTKQNGKTSRATTLETLSIKKERDERDTESCLTILAKVGALSFFSVRNRYCNSLELILNVHWSSCAKILHTTSKDYSTTTHSLFHSYSIHFNTYKTDEQNMQCTILYVIQRYPHSHMWRIYSIFLCYSC